MGKVLQLKKRPTAPKIIKFGTISEQDGRIVFEGFMVDCGSQPETPEVILVELVMQRLGKIIKTVTVKK